MKKLGALIAAAAMSVALPSVANATVNITNIGFNPSAVTGAITFAPAGLNNSVLSIGRFQLDGVTVPGGAPVSYLSYCVDLFKAITTGQFQEASPISAIASNATKQAQLAALVSNFDPLITGNTATDQDRAAALQLSIWEVIGETATSGYSLANGMFQGTVSSGGAGNAVSIANGWLGQLNAGTLQAVPGRDVRVLFSRDNQSQIYLQPVPEPGTWAMMIMGFGVIGATIRRRRTAGTLATA